METLGRWNDFNSSIVIVSTYLPWNSAPSGKIAPYGPMDAASNGLDI
jgi:hypothetical protein